jgi:uncharacterized coiled-coil protein SlyX
MRFQKFFEFNQKDLDPIKSFYIKDELNPKIWSDFKLDQDVRENLLTIARDFFETLDTECEVKDIALCGSLCNYNWSEKYSDYDLHIIIDYRDIDENLELVEKFCDYAKKQWNSNHDIKIKGYEVEVAIQDEKDLKTAISTGRMGGVFSLMKNKWTKKPEKVEFIPDEKTLERKATVLMDTIDELEEEVDEDKYTKFKEKIDRLWKKIKKYRQSGLEEEGEYSTGNLLFKLLRRNGYISKVMDLKKKSYDQQFEAKYFKFYVHFLRILLSVCFHLNLDLFFYVCTPIRMRPLLVRPELIMFTIVTHTSTYMSVGTLSCLSGHKSKKWCLEPRASGQSSL